MKFALTFISLWLLSCLVVAQNKVKIDSLKKVLKTNISDRQKVDVYNLIAKEYRFTNFAQVNYYTTQAINLARKEHHIAGIADAWYHLGWITMFKGEYSQALKCFEQTLEAATKISYKKGLANACNGKGTAYWYQGNYSKALKSHQRSLKLRKQIGDKEGMGWSYNNIGITHKKQGDNAKALESHQRSLTIFTEIGFKRGIVSSYYNTGTIYHYQGNYSKALNFYQHSLKIEENQLKNKWWLALHYNYIGDIYRLQKKFLESMKFHKKALQLRKKGRDKSGIAECHLSLGKLALAQKRFADAKKNFSKALALRQETGEKDLSAEAWVNLGIAHYTQQNYGEAQVHLKKGVQTALKTSNPLTIRDGAKYLIKVYEAMGRYKEALTNHKLFKKMEDSLLNEKNIRKIVRLEAKKREDSLQLIQAKQTVQYQGSIKKHKSRQQLILAGLGLSLVLIISLLVFYRNKQHNNRKVQASNDKINKQQEALKIRQASLEQAQLLVTIGQEITSSLDLHKVFDIAYIYLVQWMDVHNFGIGIYEPQNEQVTLRFTFGKTTYTKPFTQSIASKNHLAIWCIRHRKSIRIDDFAQEHQQYVPDYPKQTSTPDKTPVSVMYTPLIIQEVTVGAIGVHSYKKNAYTDYHFSLLGNLSFYVAIAINNAQIYKKLEASHQNIRLLSTIGQKITSTLDLDKVLHTVYEHIHQLMDTTIFGIGIYEPHNRQIIFSLVISKGKPYKTYTRSMTDKNQMAVWCIDHRQAVRIGDFACEYQNYITTYNTASVVLRDSSTEPPSSLIYIPLVVQQQIKGVLSVLSYQKNAYTDHHFDLLQNLSIYVATAIDNAQVYTEVVAQKEEISRQNKEIRQQKKELVTQHTHLEQSHQNVQSLSAIGQQVTSSLDLEKILHTFYDHINQLMDAENCGIGFYEPQKQQIAFRLNISQGKQVSGFSLDTNNKSQLAVWSIDNKQAFKIGNITQEYQQYIPDIEADIQQLENISASPPTSIMGIPLMIQDKAIGVIMINSYQKNAYTQYDFNLLKNLSIYVATAIDNARIHKETVVQKEVIVQQKEEISQQKEQLQIQHLHLVKSHKNTRLLSSIGKHITSSLDLDKLLHTIYQHINQLMDATNFAIGIYNPQQQQINFRFTIAQGKQVPDFCLNTSEKNQLLVWNIDNQQAFNIGDLENEYDQYVHDIKAESRLLNQISIPLPVSAIGIPLIIQEKVIGVIVVNSYKKNAYTSDQFNVLKSLSVYIATAINNARIYKEMVVQKEEIGKQSNLINLLLNENQHRVGNDFVAMYAKVAAIGDVQLNENARQLVEETKKRITEAIELQNLLSYPFHKQKQNCNQHEIHDRLHAIAHTLYELHFDKSDIHSLAIRNEVTHMDKNHLTMVAFCVFELVKNACKHAFKGKAVDYPANIDITLTEINKVVTLILKNNGKSLSPSLFDETGKFNFKKHNVNKGMNIVQAITTREGGSFTICTAGVHPDIEEGSMFICTFG